MTSPQDSWQPLVFVHILQPYEGGRLFVVSHEAEEDKERNDQAEYWAVAVQTWLSSGEPAKYIPPNVRLRFIPTRVDSHGTEINHR